MNNLNKLTSWEWKGLDEGFNIADGHAHQKQDPAYLKIIDKLPELFRASERGNQKEIQKKFEHVFFGQAGQNWYKNLQPPLYQTACSLSIEVVANYLRLTKKSVALLHPTFDNLADILKRHGIPMTPLDEKEILNPEKTLKNLQTDALFLVCPNNPTGTEITKEQFQSLVQFCKKHKKILILDCSFRSYSHFTLWDQYEILDKSAIDFIVLEDTGKTWPTLELKIGIMLASKSLYSHLADITNDFLLNVSPFSFNLLTQYITAEKNDTSFYGPRKIAAENRKQLEKILKNLPLTMENPASSLSVAWIKLPKKWRATKFCKWLGENNVHVLPGPPFFWNNPEKGESYIRIALLRPKEAFKKALSRLQFATIRYKEDE